MRGLGDANRRADGSRASSVVQVAVDVTPASVVGALEAAALVQPVRAAADGVVTFAGPVAGRGVVAIAHPDGVSTEYEPLSPAVTAGETVARGAVVGTVTGTHGDCPPGSCLHWGARRGSDYFDPLSLLQALGPVRLLPWGPS